MTHIVGQIGVKAYDSQTGQTKFYLASNKTAAERIREETGGRITVRETGGRHLRYHEVNDYSSAVRVQKQIKANDRAEDIYIARRNKKAKALFRKITR